MKVNQAKTQAIIENPFYGFKALLQLQRDFERRTDESVTSGTDATVAQLLRNAWAEVSKEDDRVYRELFFVIVFSMGDIANRQHNIFDKTVDQGGHSKRKLFRQCLQWILKNVEGQFYSFMPVIAEYTNYENLFYNQVRSDRNKGLITSTERLDIDYQKVGMYLAKRISDPKVSKFELSLIAKFLPKIPQDNRWRKDAKTGKTVKRIKQGATLKKDTNTRLLIKNVCEPLGWDSIKYRKFRSEHLALTEAHLFSSGKIRDFDKVQFVSWLESLPSDARHRVQCRIIDKDGTTLMPNGKWTLKSGDHDMGALYLQWMADKEQAMKKLAALSEAEKQNMDKKDLKDLQKQAKVTTGASTIFDAFKDLYAGTSRIQEAAETSVKLQTLVDKVRIDVPVMVVLDNSGSMQTIISVGDFTVERLEFAKLVSALMLYKNPNPDMQSFMIKFNTKASVIADGGYTTTALGRNRFVGTSEVTKVESLVYKDKPFIETFKQINGMIRAEGSTDLGSVAEALKSWVNEDPLTKSMRIESINDYPVWLIISDGDLNNSYSAESSMQEFKSKMLSYFGASPVIVLWDIKDTRYGSEKSYFENIDNMVHLSGFNPAIINQIFTNIDDLDVLDVYISLKTAHASNRYDPVKQLVL